MTAGGWGLKAALMALALVVGGASGHTASIVGGRLDDPALEARAHKISRSLRCLVCQNESIEDSKADLARDLRRIVRERLAAGETDDQVRAFIVARYGDWVLLKPPFKAETYLLWIGPGLLILAGGLGVWLYYRRRQIPAVAPLNAEEQERLAALLDDDSADG